MSSQFWTRLAEPVNSLSCCLTGTGRKTDCSSGAVDDFASDPAYVCILTHVLASTISATASSKAGEVISTVDMMARSQIAAYNQLQGIGRRFSVCTGEG